MRKSNHSHFHVIIIVVLFLSTNLPIALAQLDQGWEKTFGGSGHERGLDVQYCSDGGFVVVGSSDSFGDGSEDVYLIKVDSNGNLEWEKTYGTSLDEYGYSVKEVEDGFILLGWSESDVYLIKTDLTGDLLWEKILNGNQVLMTQDKGFIILGSSLVRLDSNADKIWEKPISGESIQYSIDSRYIITGESSLIKTDLNGNIISEITPLPDDLIHLDSDGGYIVKYHEGASDAFSVGKINEDGDEMWRTGVIGYRSCFEEIFRVYNGYLIFWIETPGPPEPYEIRISKYDLFGNALWTRDLDEGTWGYPQLLDGEILCVLAPWWSGLHRLQKYNLNGVLIWDKELEVFDHDSIISSFQSVDDGYIITGYSTFVIDLPGGYEIRETGDIILLWLGPDCVPDFVIPEYKYGTFTAILSMTLAAILYSFVLRRIK
jgi:hypothetical protein